MCNVSIVAFTKRLPIYLSEILACDLNTNDFCYQVSTIFDAVLRAVDRECRLSANYLKGHGTMFLYWLTNNQLGALMVPIKRASVSRQDLAVEGAAMVYWNRR